VVDA
jgi:predicted metalloprotease with PDZ domain